MKKRDLAFGLIGGIGAAIAVKMLTRPATVDWNDANGDVAHPENSHFVNVDGIRIHFQEFGDAANPPLVLIHGYTASVYVWRYAAPLLAAAGLRVLAIDLVGFGYSEKPRWFDYSIDSQARVIERFMDTLGIGRAVVVGSSYGGAVAATLALDYTERVEKLVLVDAVANNDLMQGPLFKLGSIPGIGETVTLFLAGSASFHRHKMKTTFSPENRSLVTEERVSAISRPLTSADAHHSLLATARNWHANRISFDAHLIGKPTLIIWGENDVVIPVIDGEFLHERIEGSRMIVFPSCGHVPMEERPTLFSDLIADFCAVHAVAETGG